MTSLVICEITYDVISIHYASICYISPVPLPMTRDRISGHTVTKMKLSWHKWRLLEASNASLKKQCAIFSIRYDLCWIKVATNAAVIQMTDSNIKTISAVVAFFKTNMYCDKVTIKIVPLAVSVDRVSLYMVSKKNLSRYWCLGNFKRRALISSEMPIWLSISNHKMYCVAKWSCYKFIIASHLNCAKCKCSYRQLHTSWFQTCSRI